MTQSTDAWDDDRLAGAFRARTDGQPVPADLAAVVVEQIRRRPVDRSNRLSRRTVAFSLVSAAVVAVLVGVVAVFPRHSWPAASPSNVLGLTTLSVAEAIAVRDGDPGDREIAVRGWFSIAPTVHCLATPPAAANPVRLECPFDDQWLLNSSEPLGAIRSSLPPGRIGFQPLLPFLDTTALAAAAQRGTAAGVLPEIVLIGHFHDRRGHGALCDVPDPAACAGFVADAIYSIDGVRAPPSTVIDTEPWEPALRHEPKWTPDDVDRLFHAAVPGLEILSRVALPGHRISVIEPALGTGALGIIDRDVVWSVTGLDVGAGGVPVRRTFLIVDGTGEAYESAPWDVSNIGFVPFAIVPLPTEPSPVPASLEPSGDPFAGAPTSVFGIGVGSIPTTLELHPQRDSAEIAVRGWYVPPDPAASCPLLHDAIRPVEVPCNAGRHWLLDRPQQLWADPLKVDIDRQPTGAYLNPIVPFDVSIDVPSGWQDGSPEPWPVILVGHFADPRPSTQGGRLAFTVDALAWQRGDPPGSSDPPRTTASFQRATESEDVVRRRLDDRLGPSFATWLTVVSGTELQLVDPDVEPGRSDLAEAPVVWVARRLVDERDGDLVRKVVTTAMTVDGSDRIWERRDCCSFELATTIDVRLARAGDDPGLLRVADDLGRVWSARIDPSVEVRTWRKIGPEGFTMRVGATDDPRELVIDWPWPSCKPAFRIHITAELWIGFTMTPFIEGSCPRPPVATSVVLTFREPVDIRAVHTDESLSGG